VIVSFARSFLFVAIPKTATQALRAALRPHLGAHDWEQHVLYEKQYFPVEPLARIGHGHITCQEVRPFLIPGLWERLFKFSVVRNPYERFVSYVYFHYRADPALARDPLGTLKRALTVTAPNRWTVPQTHYVTDADGRLLVDHVARFEALQEHFDVICRRIGVPVSTLPRVNVGNAPPYATCYDAELRDMAREAYADDFRLFGYSTDLEPASDRHPFTAV
jgi:hypothetical protein